MIAITNGDVLTVSRQRYNQGVILIKQGKIVDIGNKNQISIPSDVETIDASGKLITPGLIDVHTHLGLDEEGIGWEGDDYNETSEPITPHVRAIDGINPFDLGFTDAAKAGITTVQVMPGSANVIGGLMCCLKVKPGSIVEEMIVRHPSGLKLAFGENPKRFYGKKNKAPLTRMGLAGLIREKFTEAQNYMQKKEQGESEVNLQLEALVLALKKEIPVRAHAHRADDIMTAIRLAQEFNLDLSIEHATEGHKIAVHIAQSGVAVAIGPTLSNRSKVELKDKTWETYAILAQHGIPFSLITDHPVIPIEHLITSASFAVQAGLSQDKAWQALTTHAARHIGLEQRIGSLEVGKDADLVIWSGNPLEGNATVIMTMVEGKMTYLAD